MMNAVEIIRAIMKRKKITQYSDLCEMITGKREVNTTYWRFIKGEGSKLDTFLTIIDALGYEVIVRPKGKFRPRYFLVSSKGDKE